MGAGRDPLTAIEPVGVGDIFAQRWGNYSLPVQGVEAVLAAQPDPTRITTLTSGPRSEQCHPADTVHAAPWGAVARSLAADGNKRMRPAVCNGVMFARRTAP